MRPALFCYAEDVLRSVVRDVLRSVVRVVLRINAQGIDAIVDVLI